MSFHSKGPRRYGHVPPVQYGSSNGQDSNFTNRTIQRQLGLNTGNEMTTIDLFNDHLESDLSSVPSRPSISGKGDVCLTNSTLSQSHHMLSFESNGNTSSAFSGYQHEEIPFQPPPNQSSPRAQFSYNPTNTTSAEFIRPLSPPQRQLPSSQSISNPPLYNSSVYQISLPSASPMQSSRYESYSQKSFNSAENSTSLPHWQQVSSFYEQISAPPQHESPIPSSNIHNEFSSIPSSLRKALSTSASNPINKYHNQEVYRSQSLSHSTFIDYHTDKSELQLNNRTCSSTDYNSFEDRSAHSSDVARSVPINGYSLQRHPTLRPLPSAPVEEEDEEHNWDSESFDKNLRQEQLFADIGDALRASDSTKRKLVLYNQWDRDIPEIGDVNAHHHSQSGHLNLTGASVQTKSNFNITENGTYYDDAEDSDEDSPCDFEAAAGLEAMRIAEEQDLYSGTGISSFGAYKSHQTSVQPSAKEKHETTEEIMDLSSVGGGYDFRMAYGDEFPVKNPLEYHNLFKKQNLRIPSFEIERSTKGHDIADTFIPGGVSETNIEGEILFPAFETETSNHTNTGRLHRLSFDEGDEQRLLHSRRSSGSERKSPSWDNMSETFYYPEVGSSYSTTRSSERPLPPVPAISDNTNNQLVTVESLHKHQNRENSRSAFHFITAQDVHGLHCIPTRTGQHISRSSSFSNHSSAPHMIPPVRSKTDAEERQARQKAARMGIYAASGIDGFDIENSQTLLPIDLPSLPVGRQKKLFPARLSRSDFIKCNEPWALSSIALWIREIAGGETGEGESDLRIKAIEEGLVALFTYYVPMMNTADAETLSQRIVNAMLDAGLLVREEEWVKLGSGEISGVLWQLTGSGCYSPKVHENEIHGRCYSYHCTRTLKKINLQTQSLEPSRKSEDWMTFYKLTAEQVEGISKKEIQRQNNLHEIVMSEDLYMDQINILRILYRDELSSWQPPIIAKEKLPKFIGIVFGKVQAIKAVNESYLLAQLKYRQKEQGPWIIGFSDIFREWIRKAKAVYIEYAAGFPHASYLVRKEAGKNLLFRQFLDQARDNKLSGRLDWNTYLKAPITRLQRYSLLLGTVHHNMTQETEEKSNLALAIEEIKAVTHECDAKVDEQSKKVEMLELRSKLHLRPGMSGVELNLDHLGRKIIFQGDLQRAGANRFTWLETHAILLDNYLILAKTISKGDSIYARKKEAYDVSKLPIPMQLLVLESTNDDPVVKSSVKGISAMTSVTKTATQSTLISASRSNTEISEKFAALEHTVSNQSTSTIPSGSRNHSGSINDSDTRLMYPFRVKHLGKTEVYTLYAPSALSRSEWCEKILEAKIKFTVSLYEQNAEPFKLRVMADCAFSLDSLSVPSQKPIFSVTGTPLDRAIRDMEKVYGVSPRPGPICRAQVNCATAFNFYGKPMVAIGTDYGVYISEESNPRGWNRSIQVTRVTQIAVLEDFSVCLIIADKALIAYPLETLAPISGYSPPPHDSSVRRAPLKLSGARDVSFFATSRMKNRTLIFYKKREGLHSTFKVLEPVFHKSSEKKSRLLGKLKGGTTEFFRAYDEFYIPTECFTINLFHSYIAISTLKGFELMTLDKKVPMSIPDTKDPAISSITARLTGQKPLGMFRLSTVEFLLCYEECGVYVDKHGDVSRSVIMEFVGKAKTAAMYGAYLVLFDSDFVEVRNAENGRLRQVIAGKDVKCLDFGVNPLGIGTTANGIGNAMKNRSLKFVMAHPEMIGNQLVLEMELNKGHYD